MPEQCVILVGGLGTRLAELTRDHPKPLLTVGDAPFLDELIWRLERFQFRRVLLLAGYRAEKFKGYLAQLFKDRAIDVELIVEPHPLGTAGALHFAADKLDPSFYLLNGDSLFDFNWLDLIPFSEGRAPLIAMALRHEHDASRFGVVDIDRDRVVGFRERGGAAGGTINGGVYLVSRDIVPFLPENGSLERDVLPKLCTSGRVHGRTYEGFFIDIGTPASFTQAPALLRVNKQRAALFLDSSYVLDGGSDRVGTWLPGAVDAIKWINDSGRYVFLMMGGDEPSSAAGPGAQDKAIGDTMQRELRAHGAHFDDICLNSFAPSGARKPEPNMISTLMARWPIDARGSFRIVGRPADASAASGSAVGAHVFAGGNLLDAIEPLLR